MDPIVESDAALFHRAFGTHAQFRVTAPGRVVLLGDHIDYAGLSVLPMAIDRHVSLLVRARADDAIRLDTGDAQYEARTFPIQRADRPFGVGDWGNYVKAAVHEFARDLRRPRGFDALVRSTLPAAAGLSSSSALVVAAARAFLHVNEGEVEPMALASRCAVAERFVGTEGGGMDQAICIGAVRGHAARVDFEPLQIDPIPVPPGWRFIIAHSLIRAEKSGAARAAYNRRVQESRGALALIASSLDYRSGTLRRLFEAEGAARLAETAELLPPVLAARARHVISEAARVHAGEIAMRNRDGIRFGALMCESHASLRDDYEVSIPALDELVGIASDAGAAGARLSGAGFGGCVVALTDTETCESVIEAMRGRFFAARGVRDDADVLLVAHASDGVRVHGID